MTAKQKPTKETLANVLAHLVQDPVLANSMRAQGMSPNSIFVWAKLSREGDERFRLRWPDPNGAEIAFHEGIVLARQMQCANFEATLRRDVTNGTPRTLRTPDGMPVWEIDPLAVAQWKTAEDAEGLGGLIDWPYVHDQQGARVAVVVYGQAPAALRQHAARSLLAGFNPSDRKEVDARHSGGVMIVKATTQGASTKQAPPPYSREAMAQQQAEPVSDLKRDLLQRLEDLRQRGPTNPRPQRPVSVGGYGRADDPDEGGT